MKLRAKVGNVPRIDKNTVLCLLLQLREEGVGQEKEDRDEDEYIKWVFSCHRKLCH